jgi:hypothetical protein
MHLTDDDLVLHYYGEQDADARRQAVAHLASCTRCEVSYDHLRSVLATVDAAPDPVLPDGFERTVWARLQPELPTVTRGWLQWFVLSPARLAWAAAVIVLVSASFFAGRVTERGTQPGTAAEDNADIRERILLVDLGEHLDRSQMMLVELVSAGGDGTIDISGERERAEELVAANRLYRQTAAATGDAAVSELLDELERVLVELSASPDELTATEMDNVRQRIESRNLLFKVRVVSSSVRERQKQEIRTRTGQSS